MSTPSAAPPSADLRILRDSTERALEQEGIPMILGLVDERPRRSVAAASEAVRAQGAALAESLAEHGTRLAPTQRDDDQMMTITLVIATAYADFDRSRG